jgi:hypothetical protein
VPIFPGGLDNITESVTNSTPQNGVHSGLHNQLADVVNAIEVELLPGGSMNLAAHAAAADPHPVYLTQLEGDGRYVTLATQQLTMYHQEFTPTAGATTVTLSHAPEAVLIVARAGVVQSVTAGHYSLAGSVVTVPSAFSGSELVIVAYSVRGP